MEGNGQGFPQGMLAASGASSLPMVKALHFGEGISSLKWRKEKGVHQKGTDTYNGKSPNSISKLHAPGTCSSTRKNNTASMFTFTSVNEQPLIWSKKV